MAKFHLYLQKLINGGAYCSYSTTAKTIIYPASKPPPDKYLNLCSKGLINEAFKTFNSYIYSDPSLYSYLIKACIQIHSLSLVQQLHSLIITSGCSSTRFVTNHLLNAYVKFGQLQIAGLLYDVMPNKNIMSCNILIGGFVQSGDLGKAVKVFDEMPERNIATWNAMIAGFTEFERNEEALRLFSKMHGLGFCPDEFTLGSVLRGCAGLRSLTAGRQVHTYAVKFGIEINVVVGSSLTHMYIKSGSLTEGEKVIKSMPVHSVAVYNTLITGRAQSGCSEEALCQYFLMKMAGFRPDKITFVTVLSSCSQLATLGQGQQIHVEAIKSGATSSVSVLSSLVSMYSRCGCLKDSVKAFSETKVSDVVLWSSMIAAYGFHGMGKEAVELFDQMEKENLEANDVTFLSLLYACSHCGLKDQGIRIFDLMTDKYGLEPRLEHYTCLVDLLGRSGSLEEAEAVIRSMPVNVNADSIIWKTLLSACRIYKNADMAIRIAEEVLRVDPHDSASYILLSNIQASAKKWQNMSDFRKTMRDMRVKKEPGVSWFEMKNQVHRFCMSDKSHPDSKNIDLYLKKLIAEMKLLGYKPDYGSNIHDTDLEEKEDDLVHHSEKLAIAFALMNTTDCVPIRVMKNLRVCNDCHVAIKYISAVKNREIVLRDTSRFHHFKDGQCSCGDYWYRIHPTLQSNRKRCLRSSTLNGASRVCADELLQSQTAEQLVLSPEYIDLGDCTNVCEFCGAMFWFAERVISAPSSQRPKYFVCCRREQVSIDFPVGPPDVMRRLFDDTHFMCNIRAYSSMFSVTSFGAKVDETINRGHEPYVSKITGQISHWVGSLCPPLSG